MSLLSWLGFFLNMATAGGFVLVCILYAKRIRGAGPWLVASLGVIEALLMLMFRVHRMMGRDPSQSFYDYEQQMVVLESLDALATFVSVILVLVGFALMMPRTPPRSVQ